ncbi:MAG: hypothetical protein ACOY3Z_03650 [Thermodesulfobacteriota bacterium]
MRSKMGSRAGAGWLEWLQGSGRQEVARHGWRSTGTERPHPMLWRSREDYLSIPTFIRQGRLIG